MIIRVVDYVANPGGGVRFTAELVRALLARTCERFEVVSSGSALVTYQALLPRSERVTFLEIPPANLARMRTVMEGIPGAGPLNWLLRTRSFHFEVPSQALAGGDVVWFPWLHRHRIPWAQADRVVANLHDVIAIDFPGTLPRFQRRDERATVRQWLRSSARIAVSSCATARRLQELFGAAPARTAIVPLSGSHARPAAPRLTEPWPFEVRPYLLSPINLTPHKNYEVLLAGVAGWGARHPLVVTGSQTDLWATQVRRARVLRRLAIRLGLTPGRGLFPLGYVDDPTYYALLDGAWALVMPTLAEGGGSFPVWEALLAGVPVVCADIPVMREMVDRLGAQVIWFDPRRPKDLAVRLTELEAEYARFKSSALAQVSTLRERTWGDVAADLLGLMAKPAARACG